jgi:transposase, IS6 family
MVSAFRLSHRDVEELLADRGIEVDHVTLYRWVQHFTLLAVAAGPCRHTAGVGWLVDETYVKVAGVWRHLDRAVDEHGQVIDILVSARRDIAAARRFFVRMLAVQKDPEDVTTDRAPTLAAVIAELLPAAVHVTEQQLNNRMECDHGGLKARLQPMGGLKTFRSARTSEGIR